MVQESSEPIDLDDNTCGASLKEVMDFFTIFDDLVFCTKNRELVEKMGDCLERIERDEGRICFRIRSHGCISTL